MRPRPVPWVAALALATLLSCSSDETGQPALVDVQALAAQVRQTETAFAATMAARDHAAFAGFVAGDAVFVGEDRAMRGREEVARGWEPYFDGPKPPFSWEPERVEVLDSGRLALSTGPVRDSDGNLAGTFSSIWRLEPDGRWRVVFDQGCPPCDCR
jgi:ketosteroid isomerase-like protein